jgi:hypothetical protein
MSPITFLPANPGTRHTRTPKKCLRPECENMHTRRGDYCSPYCSRTAWKKRNIERVREQQRESRKKINAMEKVKPKRDWMADILSCRSDDGTCRYFGT